MLMRTILTTPNPTASLHQRAPLRLWDNLHKTQHPMVLPQPLLRRPDASPDHPNHSRDMYPLVHRSDPRDRFTVYPC